MDLRSLSSGQRYQLSATCTPPITSYTVNTNNKSSPLKLSDCEREREREREIVRDAEHERSAVLLSNESPELPPRLLDGLLVLSAHGWVLLRHFSTILQTKQPNQKPKKYIQRSSIQKCRSIKETQTRTNRTQNSLILDRWRSVTNLGKQRSRFEKWENSNPRERERKREWHESNTGLGEWGYKGEAKRPVEKKVLVVFFKAVGLRWSCG